MVTKATRTIMMMLALVLAVPAAVAEGAHEQPWNQPADQRQPRNDGKSIWQRLVPSFSTTGRAKVDGDLTPTTNYTNRDNAKAAEHPAVAHTTPRRITPVKVTAKARKVAGGKKAQKKTTEAWWWENVGNPPVDKLRACISKFAADEALRDPAAQPDAIMTRAIGSSCQSDYTAMVDVLSHGLAKARYDAAMKELRRTTFVPAATAATDTARAEARRKASVAVSEPPNLALAKQAMFDCFNREADGLALQNAAAARLLAREVVARCDEPTRGFFDTLFIAYPVDKKSHDASIRIAVEQNYMPAIADRIRIVRQGQPAIGSNTSGNAADAPANTTVVTKQ